MAGDIDHGHEVSEGQQRAGTRISANFRPDLRSFLQTVREDRLLQDKLIDDFFSDEEDLADDLIRSILECDVPEGSSRSSDNNSTGLKPHVMLVHGPDRDIDDVWPIAGQQHAHRTPATNTLAFPYAMELQWSSSHGVLMSKAVAQLQLQHSTLRRTCSVPRFLTQSEFHPQQQQLSRLCRSTSTNQTISAATDQQGDQQRSVCQRAAALDGQPLGHCVSPMTESATAKASLCPASCLSQNCPLEMEMPGSLQLSGPNISQDNLLSCRKDSDLRPISRSESEFYICSQQMDPPDAPSIYPNGGNSDSSPQNKCHAVDEISVQHNRTSTRPSGSVFMSFLFPCFRTSTFI